MNIDNEYNACLDKVASVKKYNDFDFFIETNEKTYLLLEKKILEESKEVGNERIWNDTSVVFLFPEIHFYPLNYDFSIAKANE